MAVKYNGQTVQRTMLNTVNTGTRLFGMKPGLCKGDGGPQAEGDKKNITKRGGIQAS